MLKGRLKTLHIKRRDARWQEIKLRIKSLLNLLKKDRVQISAKKGEYGNSITVSLHITKPDLTRSSIHVTADNIGDYEQDHLFKQLLAHALIIQDGNLGSFLPAPRN